MRPVALALLVLLAPAAAAQEGLPYMLHMQDLAYYPQNLTVPAGVEILAMSFGMSDDAEPVDHTVTSATDPALFDVQAIRPDGQPRPFHAPSVPGTYPFYCAYHGTAAGEGMAGTLVVTEAPPTEVARASAPVEGNDAPAPAGVWLVLALVAAVLLVRSRRAAP